MRNKLSSVFIIDRASQDKSKYTILCLLDLVTRTYYLVLRFLSIYRYDLAYFWKFMGFVSYLRNPYIVASVAFILAILPKIWA